MIDTLDREFLTLCKSLTLMLAGRK